MGFSDIVKLISGIVLFLYGMSVMGDGLKKVAGNKLESLLYKLTNTPLKGILLGAGVTAVIQSSSATTVMVVGFVNSGMMKVSQAIGIIMGANIGTSITGWILCLSAMDGAAGGVAQIFSSATIAAVVAIIGIIFRNFVKKEIYNYVGDIMLGFSVLMIGMQMMTGGVSPLKSNPDFLNLLTKFSNPFVGILVGIVFTAVLQSASASVGILQTISNTGGISFATALPITMGIGVGAACPVLLSAIGTNKNGKRTALIYLLNDLFGMVFWSIAFYSANAIVGGFSFMGVTMSPVTIALMNTVFRILTIIVLSPFIKQIEKFVFVLVKDDVNEEDPEDMEEFDLLEERFLEYPDLAIAQSHTVMNGMAKKARKNVYRAMDLMYEFSEDKFKKVQEKEALIDKYEDKLGSYLLLLTGKDMNVSQTKQTSKFLHTISDFERIGDHASGISKVARELSDKKISFSEDAVKELDVLEKATREIVEKTVDIFIDDDLEKSRNIEPLRQTIHILCGELKGRHVKRLQKGKCDLQHGFAFNDLLNNIDRIAAHCSNIAVAMIEIEYVDFDTHEYLKEIREMKDKDYVKKFEEYTKKYSLSDKKTKKNK